MRLTAVGALLLAVLAPAGVGAQEPIERDDPVVIILDASGSMNADDGSGQPRMQTAKESLATVVGLLPAGTPVGLVVYGHRTADNDRAAGCRDVEVVAPVAPLDAESLRGTVAGVGASGFTPLGLALQQAGAALPAGSGGTIVLISDGIDTCAPPDPCASARELAARDDVEITVEAVGFQVDPEARAQLSCIADAGGGDYRDARDADELAEALAQVGGTTVAGGRGLSDALVLESGRFRDELAVGDERWYAVELADGQRLAVVTTLANVPAGPHPEDTAFTAMLQRPDLLGGVSCDEASGTRVGWQPVELSLRGLVVDTASGTGRCTEAGLHYLVLGIEQGEDEAPSPEPSGDITYDVEFVVDVLGQPVVIETPSPPRDRPAEPLTPPEEPSAVPTWAQAFTALVAAAIGIAVGGLVGRRTGA